MGNNKKIGRYIVECESYVKYNEKIIPMKLIAD